MNVRAACLTMLFGALMGTPSLYGQHVMERIGRGLVAVRTGSMEVYVGWRLLGTDPDGIAFNVYRSIDGRAPAKALFAKRPSGLFVARPRCADVNKCSPGSPGLGPGRSAPTAFVAGIHKARTSW